MQIKKEYIRKQIANAAKGLYLQNGFIKTSMRDIADKAGVSVSNLYNYFENKNELFGYIVSPLIKEMEQILRDHNNARYNEQFLQFSNGENNEMMPEHMKVYIKLIANHQDELRLILFKAQGSAWENYIDEYTDKCTRQVIEFMNNFKRQHPHIGMVSTPFTYHIHTVWMFSFISEIIKHNLSLKETEWALEDYIRFEYDGWRLIMNNMEGS